MYTRRKIQADGSLLIEGIFWIRGEKRKFESTVHLQNMESREEKAHFIRVARSQLKDFAKSEISRAGPITHRWFSLMEAGDLSVKLSHAGFPMDLVRPLNTPIFYRDPPFGELDLLAHWPLTDPNAPPLRVKYVGRETREREGVIIYKFTR